MKRLTTFICVSLMALFVGTACPNGGGNDAGDTGADGGEEMDTSDSTDQTMTLTLTTSNLPELSDNYEWEGWLIVDGSPVSTGKFTQQSGMTDYQFDVAQSDAQDAGKFVLTVEPASESDSNTTPSDWKFLAANLSDMSGTANLTTAPAVGANLDGGTDFTGVSGKYLLNAPSTPNVTTDDTQGIWFIDNSSGSKEAGLQVPTLPNPSSGDPAWKYEGWVVNTSGSSPQPTTTGQFLDPASRDDDAQGPNGGPMQGPAFPGQDYISDPKMLASGDYNVVLSLEPNDDVAAPFAFKPLTGEIPQGTSKGNPQSLNNNIDTAPTVSVDISSN